MSARCAGCGVDPATVFDERIGWFAWVGTSSYFPGGKFTGGGNDGPDWWSPFGCSEGISFSGNMPLDPCRKVDADEYGRVIDGGAPYWSGFETPCGSSENCNGWLSADRSASGLVDLGAAYRGSIQLLTQGNDVSDASLPVSCTTKQRLWCLGGAVWTLEFPIVVNTGQPERGVFVTRARVLAAHSEASREPTFTVRTLRSTLDSPAPSARISVSLESHRQRDLQDVQAGRSEEAARRHVHQLELVLNDTSRCPGPR